MTWWMKVFEWEAMSVIKKYNLREIPHPRVSGTTFWYRPLKKNEALAVSIVRRVGDSWDANLDEPEWATPPKRSKELQ